MDKDQVKLLTVSGILDSISILKEEINESKTFISAALKTDDANIPYKKLEEIIESLYEKNESIYNLQIELLKRNYSKELEFNGETYKPIELLKLKDKLQTDKEICNLIVENSEKFQDQETLNLTLETFQKLQQTKKDTSLVFDTLEKYNKGKI